MSDRDWCAQTIMFMILHQSFTPDVRRHWREGKLMNLTRFESFKAALPN
jgi:hypothetical protein